MVGMVTLTHQHTANKAIRRPNLNSESAIPTNRMLT